MKTATNAKSDQTEQTTSSGRLSAVDGEAVGRARESLGDVQQATRKLVADSAEIVREGATKVEEAAGRAADRTAHYVQDQPLKSLLLAAGTGALIALAAGVVSRRGR